MSRIRALNQEFDDESEGEEDNQTVTKEAQEQQAFTQYRTALSFLGEKNTEEAKQILSDLLKGDVLSEVNKEDYSGHPLVTLKYSCLRNFARILAEEEDYEGALKQFLEASRLDATDVMLWYYIGNVAINLNQFELARDAFLEGLQRSPRNWLCLDKAILVFYVLNDYLSCLVFISRAFNLDKHYLRGLAYRDAIFKEIKNILTYYPVPPEGIEKVVEYETEVGEELITEANKLKEARHAAIEKYEDTQVIKALLLHRPITVMSWVDLGMSLIHQCKTQKESFVSRLKLVESIREKECNQIEEIEDENMADVNMEDQQNAKDAGQQPVCQTDNQVEGVDVIISQENEDVKSKKRRRNSLTFLAQWVWGGKRRSARVRSTVRREAEREECNLEEALRRLVPPSLLPSSLKEGKSKDNDAVRSNDDSMDTMDLYKLFEHRETAESNGEDKPPDQKSGESESVQEGDDYFVSQQENIDVKRFLKEHDYCDMIDTLHHFLRELCEKWRLSWPKALIGIFLEAYKIAREFFVHPDLLSPSVIPEKIQTDAWMTLLYEELALDYWLQERLGDKKSEQSWNRPVPSQEVGFLDMVYSYLDGNLAFRNRYFWLKGHLYLYSGDKEAATGCLNPLSKCMESQESDADHTIFLKNCSHNNVITKLTVENVLVALFRIQNLSEIQYLFDHQRYEQLVEILKETFNYNHQAGLSPSYNKSSSLPDRSTQLAMLMDSQWNLKCYKDCFHWGEACCHEALHKYLNSDEKEQQKWATTLEKILAGLESCVLKEGLSVVDVTRLPRLVQNLTHIVCHQLESPETLISMPIESVNPWILLQQILQWEEEKGTAVVSEEEDDLPPYISILFTAHDFLSRRSWCCSNEGALLLHAMDVVIPRMHNPELQGASDKLVQAMEQVFYCLYGHPNKKAKIKSFLQDHGVPPVRLTWEHAIKLYQFYLPRELPEVDSYRYCCISADVEALYKRIIELVPAECNPDMMTEKMMNYIEGKLPQVPCPPGGYIPLPRQISSIYYLLGDYYFKNNEWFKAIQHYLLDVCVNPVRMDSWAGMGLARGSIMEVKMNSCEILKNEAEFLKLAICAHRCFRRSLDIQPKHCTLWIEYGSFAYTVHSFCSRLLKQETDSLNLEMFELLETQKEEMLNVAVNAFTTANKVWYTLGEDSGLTDERWLHHYMLGKAAEKNNQDPNVYLDHYLKAINFLHINGASYTRKIHYSNPPNLSLEALEIFYRIHASVLKWLEHNEGKDPDPAKYTLFQQTLEVAQKGPFMARHVKDLEGRSEVDEEKNKRSAPVESLLCADEEKNKRSAPVEGCLFVDKENRSAPVESSLFVDEEKTKRSAPVENSSVKQQRCSMNAGFELGAEIAAEAETVIQNVNYSIDREKEELLKYKKYKDDVNAKEKMNKKEESTRIRNPKEIAEAHEIGQSKEKEPEKTSEQIDTQQPNKNSSDTKMKPEDLGIVRRSSQESSTSVTTETSGGNSSSSDNESSSSDESSESLSSSSGCDTSSEDSEASQSNEGAAATEAKEKVKDVAHGKTGQADSCVGPELEKTDWKQVFGKLVRHCLIGLEECVLRFPQHYKALYRLTHYYFRSKEHNLGKCRALLLENYRCQPLPGRPSGSSFQGLFAEHKSSNFFNGVWRIPVPEIDRPGCFASHMSRCILLLMDVLRELLDHGLLLELCFQLRRTPDADKKYIRDSEREQLSKQALSLAIQIFRSRLQNKEENLSQLLKDIYKAYMRVQRGFPQKEHLFAALLQDAYKRYHEVDQVDMEQILQYCQHELAAVRTAVAHGSLLPSQTSSVLPTSQTDTSQQSPQVSSGQVANVSAKVSTQTSLQVPPSAPRPRGRPPGSGKAVPTEENPEYSSTKTPRSSTNWSTSSSSSKTSQPSNQPLLPSTGNLPSNYMNLHSVFSDPNFFTAAMKGKSPGIEQQLAYSMFQAQMNDYKAELLRQFSAGSLGSYSQMPSNFGFGSVAGVGYNQMNVTPPVSTPSSVVSDYVKDRPNISITPIPHSSSKHTPKNIVNYGTHNQEKSSAHQSLNASPKFQEPKYSMTNIHRNKEGLFSSVGAQSHGLSIGPASVISSPSKISSAKKGLFKTPNIVPENFGNMPHTSSVEPRTVICKSDPKACSLKRSQMDMQDFRNIPYISEPSSKSNRGLVGTPLHSTSEVTMTSPGTPGVTVLPHSKSKKLPGLPMTTVEMPLSIHPVPSTYKQATNYTENVLNKQEEKIALADSYSPPAKKLKDSVSIVEVPRLKISGKRVQVLPKMDDLKVSVPSDVEVITLE